MSLKCRAKPLMIPGPGAAWSKKGSSAAGVPVSGAVGGSLFLPRRGP